MAQNFDKKRERKIGKQEVTAKKPLIDPRYKNMVSTIVFIVVMIVFFIVNNTRTEPESGPFPPFYKKNIQSLP
ncbi:MAG: hypothetical protein Q8Q47_07090 [Ignavibacteriaceae bacterium]|nr:hypothetical protein [Ignavibacteriaceae bacterium]